MSAFTVSVFSWVGRMRYKGTGCIVYTPYSVKKSGSRMKRTVFIVLISTALIIGLPPIGLWTTDQPAAPYFQFPPLTRHVSHEPFSWPVFAVYAAFEVAIVGVLTIAARMRHLEAVRKRPASRCRFPWWGWVGLGCGLVSWALAWNRFEWFASLQVHTFLPLWLSYIVVVNALCQRSSGTCPMLGRPGYFLLLFPASAFFWWYFEYLNRFVQNWWYTGFYFGPLRYTLYASMSFSTVLPAVLSTREWIRGMDTFRSRFHGLRPIPWSFPRIAGTALLAAAGFSLACIGLYPKTLFPLVWISPLLVLTGLKQLTGQRHMFTEMAAGDWRPAVSAALAALVCGFFWEMWNIHSLAKWVYSIPYVQRFHIFEMPLLGYMGYLPFGLECIAVCDVIAEAGPRKKSPNLSILFTPTQPPPAGGG